MIVTIRSSSSVVSSPALETVVRELSEEVVGPSCVPLVQVHIGFLADQVGVTATDTLDLGQGVHDLLLSVDIGVEKTKDELEVRLFAADERPIDSRFHSSTLKLPISPTSAILLSPSLRNCRGVQVYSHGGRSCGRSPGSSNCRLA